MVVYRILSVLLLALGSAVYAEEPAEGEEAKPEGPFYFEIKKDIVTNYQRFDLKNTGYLNVGVQLVVNEEDDLATLENHEPLIKDAFVRLINQRDEDQIQSLDHKEALRQQATEELQRLFQEELGQPVVQEVLFTNYLWEG